MQEAAREKARFVITGSRNRIQRLRGTGPNPFDFWLWADETTQVLESIFGKGAAEPKEFADVVYQRGRTLDQRGSIDSMTLGIHGAWGIRARLNRAETLLNEILARMGGPSPAALRPSQD